MGDLLFEVTNRAFYAFKFVIAPQREEIKRHFSQRVWLLAERYWGHFPAFCLSQLWQYRTSSFFNFLARKKKSIKQRLMNRRFSDCRKNEKWASPKFSQLRLSRSSKNDLGTSPREVRLIPRRAGSISTLYGAITHFKAKKSLLPPKKMPHEKRLKTNRIPRT